MSTIVVPGRLTKDAELKQGQNGSFITFSVAEDVRTKDGKKSQFFDCTLNGKRGEALAPYLKKGTPITVVGDFSTREYQGKSYNQVSAQQVTLQGSKRDGDSNGAGDYGRSGTGGSAKHSAPAESDGYEPDPEYGF